MKSPLIQFILALLVAALLASLYRSGAATKGSGSQPGGGLPPAPGHGAAADAHGRRNAHGAASIDPVDGRD